MWEEDLAPLKHMIANSMSEKAILLQIIFIVELYEEEDLRSNANAHLEFLVGHFASLYFHHVQLKKI